MGNDTHSPPRPRTATTEASAEKSTKASSTARSPASVWHVIEGAATLTVGDGEGEGAEAPRFALAEADTACAPGYLPLTLANASAGAPAFVFVADESPLHQKLGLYETR